MAKLGIIIPTFNRSKYLEKLLINFKKQENCINEIEIFVVVDGSTDDTIPLLAKYFPDVHIVFGDGNWWWTKSINEGLKLAIFKGCTKFLLMNDDTFIDNNFLNIILTQYDLNGRGVLGAISITSQEPFNIFYSGIKEVNWITAKFTRYHSFSHIYSKEVKGVYKTLFIPGRGMLFDKEVIDKIGFFRDNLFPQYFADFDFTYSANKAGFSTNITWDVPIFSHVELTAKGSKTNSNFNQFIKSFFKTMSSNSINGNYRFYREHAGNYFFIGFMMHYFRIIVSFLISKFRKQYKNICL